MSHIPCPLACSNESCQLICEKVNCGRKVVYNPSLRVWMYSTKVSMLSPRNYVKGMMVGHSWPVKKPWCVVYIFATTNKHMHTLSHTPLPLSLLPFYSFARPLSKKSCWPILFSKQFIFCPCLVLWLTHAFYATLLGSSWSASSADNEVPLVML